MRCNKRELAFRFISRKWILTIIPSAVVVYLVTLHHQRLDNMLLTYIIIWASLVSTFFLLGEHVTQLMARLYSIKYKDVKINFQGDSIYERGKNGGLPTDAIDSDGATHSGN